MDKETLGIIQILVIDILATVILSGIALKKPYLCKFNFYILLGINFLLLLNAPEWNEGSGSSSYYYIAFLQPASDFLALFMVLSAFLLAIPIILYFMFLLD
ncbi:hypothetical protein [Sulfurovum mangrovi]|uniref:hypothetical protein n=1 Tax=Sulfurovum mangrovi TaxID=2893889 RepID=UPI001E405369|nr:hypothetical protein [Sulfurovum mangrovi]UFH60820.1 hypothetical protein LN246_14820 [Sulfurovum mangrovi]